MTRRTVLTACPPPADRYRVTSSRVSWL